MPRLDGLQRNRNNAPAETSNEYYQSAVRYLLLDSMLSELHFRFSEHTKIEMQVASILPAKCVTADVSVFSNTIYTLCMEHCCKISNYAKP